MIRLSILQWISLHLWRKKESVSLKCWYSLEFCSLKHWYILEFYSVLVNHLSLLILIWCCINWAAFIVFQMRWFGVCAELVLILFCATTFILELVFDLCWKWSGVWLIETNLSGTDIWKMPTLLHSGLVFLFLIWFF